MARSARFWVRSTQVATLAFCGGIAASVWILLPPAGNDLRMFAIFLYVWFVAMVMMVGANHLSVIGCLALIASLAAFVLTHDLPHAVPLAAFLVMAGVAIVGIRGLIWRAADEASEARALTRASSRIARTRACHRACRTRRQNPLHRRSIARPATTDPGTHISFMDQALESDDMALQPERARGEKRVPVGQALLETMLDHLRLDAGAVVARICDVPIDQVAGAVVLEHGPAAAVAGIDLTLVESRIVARGDARLLQRALGNLVGNAIRHAHGTRILVGARLRGGAVDLWVIDNGRGIPRRRCGAVVRGFCARLGPWAGESRRFRSRPLLGAAAGRLARGSLTSSIGAGGMALPFGSAWHIGHRVAPPTLRPVGAGMRSCLICGRSSTGTGGVGRCSRASLARRDDCGQGGELPRGAMERARLPCRISACRPDHAGGGRTRRHRRTGPRGAGHAGISHHRDRMTTGCCSI